MAFAPIYNQKVIEKQFATIEITTKQRKLANEWVKKIKNKELEKEVKNYIVFRDTILIELLGYPMEEIMFEEKDVEFSVKDVKGITHVVFEAKGTKTKDLFARQNYGKREQEHPILQTVSNMQRFAPPAAYGVCTNYDDFVLLDRELGITKCHKFKFTDIENNIDKLKEFIGIFSYEKLAKEKALEILYEKSITAEREFTKEFYKLFHETRLMLIREFEKDKPQVSHTDAIYYTQIFLNRIIFMFFVEDKGYVSDNQIFAKRIFGVLDSDQIIDISRRVFDVISELFVAYDVGSKELGIFGFNGGLFRSTSIPQKIFFSDLKDPDFFSDLRMNSSLLKTSKLNERSQKIIDRLGNKLNPIITNLLRMESFDFNTEVNVNILGHIFEQSISDIEELSKNASSKRKKDGVYYTPSQLTEYICKNTIIPYLSKTNVNTVEELAEEYKDDIELLEKKFKEIKILDPACGSGAFLIKTIDVLMEIGQAIQNIKESSGKYITDGQSILTKWSEEDTIKNIIENNIYGVDINRESVGITQLSLFLRLASQNRKLSGLSKNIQVGNSLIDQPSVDASAFIWKDRFPTIFIHPDLKKHNLVDDHEDGFDIVIGNPPWQILKPDVDEFFSPIYDMMSSSQKFSKLTKIKKNEFMKSCLNDKIVSEEWKKYQENYKKQMDYFNQSGSYRHQVSNGDGKSSSGDINLYKLFVERSYSLLKPHGYCGLIMPSGIYSDLGSKGLRELILKKNRLVHLFSFVNRNGIFEDVHRQFKFCSVVFEKNGVTEKFLASFYIQKVAYLANYKSIAYEYDLDLIQMSSPNSYSLIECKNKREFDILQKLYIHPLLISGKWDFLAKREFDMTNDSGLFHTANIGDPLYEGKMINMFTHKFADPRYWVDRHQGTKMLQEKEENRMQRVSKSHKIDPRVDSQEYRLVWRSITNSTNERTLISTIIHPNVFLGNSLNYLSPIKFDGEKYIHPISQEEIFFLCGIFNSFPVDFVLRHKVATNLNVFYLMETPIPKYDKDNTYHKKIFENTARLICTTDEYSQIADSLGISEPVFEPEKRLGLEAQINALSAKIYGLTKEDLEFILENFPIVNKKLKELTLDEFILLG